MSEASRVRKLERRTRREAHRARKKARRAERRTRREARRMRKEARWIARQTRRDFDPYAAPVDRPYAAYADQPYDAQPYAAYADQPYDAQPAAEPPHVIRVQPGQTFPEWDAIVSRAINSIGVAPLSHKDVSPRLSSNIKVELTIDGERALPQNFNVVQTVGDGTCLVHAFLTSCSAYYRAIPYSDRSRVGLEVRRQIGLPELVDNSNWLNDNFLFPLTKIARNRVLYLALLADKTENMSLIGDSGPYIIIANQDGVHYTSVTYKGKYVVQKVLM